VYAFIATTSSRRYEVALFFPLLRRAADARSAAAAQKKEHKAVAGCAAGTRSREAMEKRRWAVGL